MGLEGAGAAEGAGGGGGSEDSLPGTSSTRRCRRLSAMFFSMMLFSIRLNRSSIVFHAI